MTSRRTIRLLPLAVAASVLLSGCAVQPGLPWALIASTFAALWLWGCFSPPFEFPFLAPTDGGTQMGVGVVDAGGHWEQCCLSAADGGYEIGQCFCPEDMACNYGWFTPCADGTCNPQPNDTCAQTGDLDGGAAPDAGLDAGGTWEACCEWSGNRGVVSTCFCPENTACNYGWFSTCADGSCALSPEHCPP